MREKWTKNDFKLPYAGLATARFVARESAPNAGVNSEVSDDDDGDGDGGLCGFCAAKMT